MPRTLGPLAGLLLGTLLPISAAAAQNNVGFVCAFGYNVYDKIAWVGRSIIRVEVPEGWNTTPAGMAGYASNDIRTRMQGTYSQADRLVTNRVTADGFFGQMTSGHSSVGDARRACMELVADFRRQGYDVYGLGAPLYNGDEHLQVQHLSFLSALEYPDYVPGTVAARAQSAQGGSSSGGSGSSGGGSSDGTIPPARYENGRCIGTWWQCETPEQRAERLRLQAEREIASVRRLVGEADAAYERRAFRDALGLYRRALNFPSYVGTRDERQHARERVEYLEANLGTLEYAAASAASGLSYGVAIGQSHLAADPFGSSAGLFGLEVKHNGSRFTTMWSAGTSRVGLGRAAGDDDAYNTAGEFTEHYFALTTIVPGARLGNFGLHAGYRYQRTNRRDLHLMTTGIIWGVDPGPGFRLDITPVYGKPQFGFAILLDFSNLFD